MRIHSERELLPASAPTASTAAAATSSTAALASARPATGDDRPSVTWLCLVEEVERLATQEGELRQRREGTERASRAAVARHRGLQAKESALKQQMVNAGRSSQAASGRLEAHGTRQRDAELLVEERGDEHAKLVETAADLVESRTAAAEALADASLALRSCELSHAAEGRAHEAHSEARCGGSSRKCRDHGTGPSCVSGPGTALAAAAVLVAAIVARPASGGRCTRQVKQS